MIPMTLCEKEFDWGSTTLINIGGVPHIPTDGNYDWNSIV
jgi:hypothetical protein